MPSLRAQLFNWYMVAKVKSEPIHLLPPEVLREGADEMAPKKPPRGVTLEAVDGVVKGEWHRAVEAAPGRTVLYLHGGGYVFGSAISHRAATFSLAREAQAEVFSLDYRLAPEHPFPAAVDDALAAYRWLLDSGRNTKGLVIGGDSAGGGLALALLLSIREKGLPMPKGVFLYSPWTDLTVSGASVLANEKSDAMFKAEYISGGVRRYVPQGDLKSPLVSPLFANHAELPPTLIFASTSEVLLDDSVRLHEKLKDAGVEAELILKDGLIHVWPIFAGRFPEAMDDVRRTAQFIRERT